MILEGSPYSHYAIIDAAYNAGYIARETKSFFGDMLNQSLRALKRPNLIIYLDAPIDVVQRKIKARGNEWDKDGYIPTIILIDDTMTIRSMDENNTDASPYW